MRGSTTIPVQDIDTAEGLEGVVAMGPSSALLKLWHAEVQLDLGSISSKELAVVERLAGQVAGRARSLYNPYTGKIRRAFLPDWVGKHKADDPAQVGWRKSVEMVKPWPETTSEGFGGVLAHDTEGRS